MRRRPGSPFPPIPEVSIPDRRGDMLLAIQASFRSLQSACCFVGGALVSDLPEGALSRFITGFPLKHGSPKFFCFFVGGCGFLKLRTSLKLNQRRNPPCHGKARRRAMIQRRHQRRRLLFAGSWLHPFVSLWFSLDFGFSFGFCLLSFGFCVLSFPEPTNGPEMVPFWFP